MLTVNNFPKEPKKDLFVEIPLSLEERLSAYLERNGQTRRFVVIRALVRWLEEAEEKEGMAKAG